MGHALLDTGDLQGAREALHRLREWPFVYFDPMLILTFQARMLCLQGHYHRAKAILSAHAEHLKLRFPTIWIRAQLAQARLDARYGKGASRRSLQEALKTSVQLGLTQRTAEISHLLH
jgi:hypothetical protein